MITREEIEAGLKTYNDLRERLCDFVKQYEEFLFENSPNSRKLQGFSSGNAWFELDERWFRLYWLDYDYDENPVKRGLVFEARYLWDDDYLQRALGHFTKREYNRIDRIRVEAENKERAEYDRLRAKYEGN